MDKYDNFKSLLRDNGQLRIKIVAIIATAGISIGTIGYGLYEKHEEEIDELANAIIELYYADPDNSIISDIRNEIAENTSSKDRSELFQSTLEEIKLDQLQGVEEIQKEIEDGKIIYETINVETLKFNYYKRDDSNGWNDGNVRISFDILINNRPVHKTYVVHQSALKNWKGLVKCIDSIPKLEKTSKGNLGEANELAIKRLFEEAYKRYEEAKKSHSNTEEFYAESRINELRKNIGQTHKYDK